ncbi:MAG: hypothetical protein CME62_12450 [Halobacteriovoraceae bacterium]|nr:hypothetical protein [Halobacteriovoraceae bacterium]|tara:strand:- start:3256 stop:3447 length:192 start_codon:yes stop_codon:yes gene_type:complete
MEKNIYTAKILKDGASYTVIFPELEGCHTSGENIEHAKKMAYEALSLHLEATCKDIHINFLYV